MSIDLVNALASGAFIFFLGYRAGKRSTRREAKDASEFVQQVSARSGGPNEKLRAMRKRYLENTRQHSQRK